MKRKADHEARLILDREFPNRYNMAPTQDAVTIHRTDESMATSMRRWGLITLPSRFGGRPLTSPRHDLRE